MTFIQRLADSLFYKRITTLEGIENLPKDGACIVAPNHVSYIEPAVIATMVFHTTRRQPWSLAKDSVWKAYKKLGLADSMALVRVDPENKAACIDDLAELLRKGNIVMIYPEGTRNPKPTLLRGKTGVARLALQTGAPVIPVGYKGPPGMTNAEFIKNTFFSKLPITIRLGAPLVFPKQDAMTHEDLEHVTTKIMEAIAVLAEKPYTPDQP